MAEDKATPRQPAGEPDYGNNNPTGGTKENTGKLNPQGPTSGTENYNRDRKANQQTTAGSSPNDHASDTPLDASAGGQQDWSSRDISGFAREKGTDPANLVAQGDATRTGNLGTGPIPANAGDVQDESGNLDPGASATPGAGVGDTEGQHSFRCADAGFSDCRWQTSMASSDQLWNEIERHAGEQHGMKTLDEKTRGKIQDAIHVRRAA